MSNSRVPDLDPLPVRTLHVAIDLQRLFADGSPWAVEDFSSLVSAVARLAATHPARTVFARFIPAAHPDAAEGRWRHYYTRWATVTGARLDPALLHVVSELAPRTGSTFDKHGYSIFGSRDFRARLAADRTEALVLTGVETDVCVLASLFDAVDLGLRVVLPVDGVTSASRAAHDAVIGTLLPRLPEQVELSTVDQVLRAWPGEAEPSFANL